jgi:nitrogen regulatory protein P-II 1
MSMPLKKVTAIVRCASLEKIEEALQTLHVPGLTITHVVGFGEYANLFRHDWTSRHARIELFVDESRVEPIVRAITGAAHSGCPGDGIVAVLPVEHLYRIRDGAETIERAVQE